MHNRAKPLMLRGKPYVLDASVSYHQANVVLGGKLQPSLHVGRPRDKNRVYGTIAELTRR